MTIVSDWKSKLSKICDEYVPRDIFNMDETGLIYRAPCNKTFLVKSEDAAGGNQLSSENQQNHVVSKTSILTPSQSSIATIRKPV